MPDTINNMGATSESAVEYDEDLLPSEEWWRDRYYLLEKHGYRLRPRYHPDWVPSWKNTGKNFLFCEDSIFSKADDVLDATRISDGTVVSIKRVKKYSQELTIATCFSPTDENDKDPMNHCVPVLEHFVHEAPSEFVFLVMPLLRPFDDPPFFTVGEALDFMKQTLEGLCYMHSRGVAHRDCESMNVMIDASPLFPQGFHPAARLMDPSGSKRAPCHRRCDVSGVRYYFIDFGISSMFDETVRREDCLVTGINGRDRDVPELSRKVQYDPFAVDVFILGNVYRKKFLYKYTNLAFLSGLIRTMTSAEPEERPSAYDAFDQFKRLIAEVSPLKLRWRLKQKDSCFVDRFFVDVASSLREAKYVAKRLASEVLVLSRNLRAHNGRLHDE